MENISASKKYGFIGGILLGIFMTIMFSAFFYEKIRNTIMGKVDPELHERKEREKLDKLRKDNDYHQM